MRPLSLSARGYRSFASLEFVFPDGATAIVGPNGSGKSSLMGAVELALFGPRGRSLEPYVTEGADDLQVTLEFEHAGEDFRVRRGWKAGRSTLDFERQYPEALKDYEPLTQGNAANTQALIERTIGLTRATFLASAYLAQRESDSFTAAQPRDRKRLLSDALALDDWPKAADAVAADRRATEKEEAETSARIAVLAEQQGRALELREETDRLADATMATGLVAEQAESELVAVGDALRAAEQAESEWQTRAQALEVAAAKVAPLRDTAGQAHLARDRAESVRMDILRLEALAAEHETAQTERARLAEQDSARAEAIDAKQRLAVEATRLEATLTEHHAESVAIAAKLHALQEDATCDRCGQHVADAALDRARTSLLAEVEQINAIVSRSKLELAVLDAKIEEQIAALPEPVVGLAALDARITETRSAAADLAAARERHASITALIERAAEPAFVQALEQAEHDHQVAAKQAAAAVRPEGVDNMRAAAVSAKAAADVARQRHTNAQLEHARIVAQADQLQASAAEHETLLARREQLRADLDVLAGLEQAFGRDGVPAWIVEQQALPTIEHEANRILQRLGGGTIRRLELRSEKETKQGDRREALEIVCFAGQHEHERPYSLISGGEKTRVEIALALGMARLLGSRRDTDLRFFAADEPPGLDDQGTEALASALNELAASEGIVVLVITHDHLRDSFDNSVLCSLDQNERSVVAA